MNDLDYLLHSDVRLRILAEKKSFNAHVRVFRIKHPSGKDSSHFMSKNETSWSKLATFTLFVVTGEGRGTSSHKISTPF